MARPRKFSFPDGHWNWPFKACFSHGVRKDEMTFVGGQMDLNSSGNVLHPGDLWTQIDCAMRNVETVLQDLGGQRMADGQFGEHVGIGGVTGLGALDGRELELLKEHLGELLGGVDVEGLPGQGVDLPAEIIQVPLQLLGEGLEPLGFHPDPVKLHPRQDGNERPLHLRVEGFEPLLLEERGRMGPVAPDPAGALPDLGYALFHGRFGGRRRPRPFAEALDTDLLKLVARPLGVQEIGDQRRILKTRQGEPVPEPPLERKLHVVTDEPAVSKRRWPITDRSKRRADRRVIEADAADDGLGRAAGSYPFQGQRGLRCQRPQILGCGLRRRKDSHGLSRQLDRGPR